MAEDNNIKEISLEEVKRSASKVNEEKAKSGERIQLIVFKLGGEEYAIPIDHIKEVVITPGVAKIPQTPNYIKGVANIRGNIIAIMDLEERFGLINNFADVENHGSYTLVIESEDFKVGVLVTEVPNTLNTYSSEIDNASGIMQHSSLDQECINGVVKVDERLIILIDIFKLMKLENLNKTINI